MQRTSENSDSVTLTHYSCNNDDDELRSTGSRFFYRIGNVNSISLIDGVFHIGLIDNNIPEYTTFYHKGNTYPIVYKVIGRIIPY